VKILVINTGSSSIKYSLFDVEGRRELASGLVERIGEGKSCLTHRVFGSDGSVRERKKEGGAADHRQGMEGIMEMLAGSEGGTDVGRGDIAAVGHRVVHGGETFREPVVIDDGVVDAIRAHIPLAPLHNPPNLTGIEVARALLPSSTQVAVFDTAFHQTLPKEAFLYAVPWELYEKNGVRRYGFHGTSHAYVAGRAAEHLGRTLEELNLITVHLGNGASMAAVRGGKSVDTTMGMTPLAGLVMGTRSGDVDPALPFFLADHLGMSLRQIDDLLNRESGLKGLCGLIDMREILARRAAGDEGAATAVEVYAYRVKKYIGAFLAVLGRLEALVFTAGVGENSPEIRALCCRGLEGLGISVDAGRNGRSSGEIRDVASKASPVRILVVPTNEELRIAQETKRVVDGIGGGKGKP
jgi:acetate kinase